MAKKEEVEETFIRVTSREEEDGVTVYSDSEGVDVALTLPRGAVVDLRIQPPFLSMFPCPYCGDSEIVIDRKRNVATDRGHNPLRHINPAFGEKV